MSSDPSAPPTATCPQHPSAAAPYVCARCQSSVCIECCFSMPDGSICCRSCLEHRAPDPAVAAATTEAALPASTLPAQATTPRLTIRRSASTAEPVETPISTAPLPPGAGCVQHPDVAPVAHCRSCGAGSCRTCDFVFPINLHFCPVCAARPATQLTPRRKKYVVSGLILGGWSTLCLFVLLSGVLAEIEGPFGEIFLGMVVILVMLVPAIVGTALGLSAFRRTGNPISVWITLVWNALIVSGFVLLIVIGNLAE